jgi:hypothetical protein
MKWLDKLNEPKVSAGMKPLIDLMKRGKLPTEFPRILPSKGFAFVPLRFDPASTPIMKVDGDMNCQLIGMAGTSPNDYFSKTQRNAFIIAAGDHINASCAWSNQLYFSGAGKDVINDSWGDDIFATGGGSDEINAGWGQDIVILQKGWGTLTLNKTCSQASLNAQTNFFVPLDVEAGGIGIVAARDDGGIMVKSVIPGEAASRAGLQTGVVITEIDGKPIAGIEFPEQVRLLRGTVGHPVRIGYKNGPVQSHLDIIRGDIGQQDSNNNKGLTEVKALWPYPYNNFIVFGPGIHRSDMVWQQGGALVNPKTKDERDFRGGSCFNLVYEDDQ